MYKWATVAFLVLFGLRLWQVGLDLQFKDPGSDLFKPWQVFLDRQIGQLMPQPQAALLSGMLLGVQSALPQALKLELQATSTIHLVVVSGQNLSLVAAFIFNSLGFLGRRPATWLTLFAIVIYSFLTGLGVPVIRAALMAGISLSGQLLGRERQSWWICLLSAGLMLLWQPNWLFNISFQLSVMATIGVVVLAPLFLARLSWVPELIRTDLAVSLAAQLMTLPIIAANFNQLSLIGVVVNVLVLWIVSPVMIIGALALVLSLIVPILGQLVGLVPGILLTYLVTVVHLGASVPGAMLTLGEFSGLIWVGYYLLLTAGMLHLSDDQRPNSPSPQARHH